MESMIDVDRAQFPAEDIGARYARVGGLAPPCLKKRHCRVQQDA
jgi:hypothetical protein